MKQAKNTTQEKKPFLVLSGKKAAGWCSLFVFSLAMMFFAGTLTGRGSIKVDLGQKKLAGDINKYAKQLETHKNENIEVIDDTPELAFYETLQKKESSERPKKKTKKNKEKKYPVKVKSIVKRTKTPYAPIKNAVVKKAVNPIKKAVKRTVRNKDNSIYKYSIQVASFKGATEAKKTVDRFVRKGYSAYYVKAVVRDNEVWYRVRIGAYKDRIDAKKTLARLEKNKVDGFLVTR